MKDSRGEEDGGVDGAECQAGATGLRSDLRAAHSPVKLRSGAGRRYTKKSFDTEYDGGKKKKKLEKKNWAALLSSPQVRPQILKGQTGRRKQYCFYYIPSFGFIAVKSLRSSRGAAGSPGSLIY